MQLLLLLHTATNEGARADSWARAFEMSAVCVLDDLVSILEDRLSCLM